MPDWPGNGSLEWSKLKVLRKVGVGVGGGGRWWAGAGFRGALGKGKG